MRRYDILVDPQSPGRAERITMHAPGPGSLFGWAQRHAAGRRFEVFEEGASLGGATYDDDAGVWTIFPPTGSAIDA